MTTAQRIAAVLTAALLAACGPTEEEVEKACFDKLAADFDREARLAAENGNHDYAITARESALEAALIWTDDDRNACDYASAGARLQRK